MFNPTLRKKTMGRNAGIMQNKIGQMAATAMAGGYKPPPTYNPVEALHKRHEAGAKIKANFVAGDGIRPNG
jgi:hypothetical protein